MIHLSAAFHSSTRSSPHHLPIEAATRVLLALAAVVGRVVAHVLSTLRRGRRDERGQATTEYALVLLAAALVALLVIAWATAGGGAARIARLFDSVIDSVIDRV